MVAEAPSRANNHIRPYSGEPTNPAMAEFFLPLAGRYRLCLTVVAEGRDHRPLTPECVTVVALPVEVMTIELTWDNLEDPDQSDDDGSDVDLHFVKMPAPWFDPVYDTYYANEEPLWDPEYPSLDIDDTDGLGPEVVQLDDPAECQWYAVGAHYFRKQYGTAWPTLHVFINGRLVEELVNRPLQETGDFWDAARIHWPSGTVVRVNELFNASAPELEYIPAITDAMRDAGLCSDL